LNSGGVTMLTRTSVHCADRMVAMSSSYGFACMSAHFGSGNTSLSLAVVSWNRLDVVMGWII